MQFLLILTNQSNINLLYERVKKNQQLQYKFCVVYLLLFILFLLLILHLFFFSNLYFLLLFYFGNKKLFTSEHLKNVEHYKNSEHATMFYYCSASRLLLEISNVPSVAISNKIKFSLHARYVDMVHIYLYGTYVEFRLQPQKFFFQIVKLWFLATLLWFLP